MNALEDPIWQMVAILTGKVEGSEMVAVLSAFVDESGTGDEPNVVLAAIVSSVSGWLDFNANWQELLTDNRLSYAHFTDMRKGRDQYEGWSIAKKEEFSRRSMRIIKANCFFGFTVSLNKELYKKYVERCRAERIGPDSAYALCAREVFGFAVRTAKDYFGYTSPMNFIFEAGHRNATYAAAVFNDLKEHSEIKDRLGFFSLEDKKKLRPLQGADHIAHQGRRNEAKALRTGGIITVAKAKYDWQFESVQKDGCPILYWSIDQEMLDFYGEQHKVLKGIKNRKKREAKA